MIALDALIAELSADPEFAKELEAARERRSTKQTSWAAAVRNIAELERLTADVDDLMRL